MKKITAVFLITLLVLSLTACGKSKTPEASSAAASSAASAASSAAASEEAESEPAGTGEVLGGWSVNGDITPCKLPEKVEAAFTKAKEGLLGNDLEPVAYLGSQVVNGTNYAVLCKSTLVTKEPVVSYQVAVIYADLKDNAEIRNIADFNIGDYTQDEGAAASGDTTAGGWSAPDEYEVVKLPDDVQDAFDSALEGFTGNNLEPLAYLGSQVVSGTNYAILCHSSLVTKDPVNSIQVVTVYKDLQGKSQISNICTVDPADFNE